MDERQRYWTSLQPRQGRQHMPTTRPAMVAAVAAAVCLTLAGCTPDPKWDPDIPTVVKTPEIVWDNGAPAGEFEDDDAVVALRSALLGMGLALNSHDYTIAQLTDFVGAEHISWM